MPCHFEIFRAKWILCKHAFFKECMCTVQRWAFLILSTLSLARIQPAFMSHLCSALVNGLMCKFDDRSQTTTHSVWGKKIQTNLMNHNKGSRQQNDIAVSFLNLSIHPHFPSLVRSCGPKTQNSLKQFSYILLWNAWWWWEFLRKWKNNCFGSNRRRIKTSSLKCLILGGPLLLKQMLRALWKVSFCEKKALLWRCSLTFIHPIFKGAYSNTHPSHLSYDKST